MRLLLLCLLLTGCAHKKAAIKLEPTPEPAKHDIYGGPCAISTNAFEAIDNANKAGCQLRTE